MQCTCRYRFPLWANKFIKVNPKQATISEFRCQTAGGSGSQRKCLTSFDCGLGLGFGIGFGFGAWFLGSQGSVGTAWVSSETDDILNTHTHTQTTTHDYPTKCYQKTSNTQKNTKLLYNFWHGLLQTKGTHLGEGRLGYVYVYRYVGPSFDIIWTLPVYWQTARTSTDGR